MNLIILNLYYLIILFSIIGYGYFLSNILKLNINAKEVVLFGILGIIFLTFISYLTNIFSPHGFTHNIIVHSIGIIIFLSAIKSEAILKKKIYVIVILSIIIVCFSLLSKTHDDFGWYHLPYTLNLSQNKFQYGLGHFNHGFRTPSSLFYLNSLFYLPGIKFYSFNFAQLYIFLFSLIYFYKKIFNRKNSSFVFFYSLLAFIFISVVFYRLAEHGTDRSGQALLFIVIVLILEILSKNLIEIKKINIIILLLVYLITIKTYFVIFILLMLPILMLIKSDYSIYKKIFFSKTIILSVLFLFLHFHVQLANSGCLLYPMNFTCYSDFTWSINRTEITNMGQWYELWAKSGANPNFRVENPTEYVSQFNWVSNWMSNYFFNKMSDLILGIILILVICFLLFKKKNKKINKQIKIYGLSYAILLLFLIWFTKFPQLRYGGFIIIANLFFLPACLFLLNYQLNKKVLKSAKYIVALSLIIFAGRNIDRLYLEINSYNYKPFKNAFFHIDSYKYNEIKLNSNIILNRTEGSCWATEQPCTHRGGIKAIKKYNYVIYY